jgi:uncharacterized membrane protein HdeD (DUF308 family)
MVFFPSSAAPTFSGEPSTRSWWLFALLGIALLIAGAFVLGDIVFASVVSAIFIAWAILIAGVLQIIHAFSARGWKGFMLDVLLGVLYVAGGVILLSNPVAASVKLTLALGIIWIVSGIFRMILAGALRREGGWGLLFSGLVSILAGVVILSRWPESGLWVLGLCLGIDLIFHGLAWIVYAMTVHAARALQKA